MGEILGAVVMAHGSCCLNTTSKLHSVKIIADGDESRDGRTVIDKKEWNKLVKILENLDPVAYHGILADQLGKKKQSAVVGSFDEQTRNWSKPPAN